MSVNKSIDRVLRDSGGNIVGTPTRPLIYLSPTEALVMTPNAGVTVGHAFGFAPGVATSSYGANATPLRENPYVQQTVGTQMSLSSSNPNDAAGTIGAQTVKITYYESTCTTLKTESINLNGTTPVNTVNTDICFIEKLEVTTAISGSNSGLIGLYSGTSGNGALVASITTGSNSMNSCHHYVAAGKTCYVMSLVMGVGRVASNMFIFLKTVNPTSATSPEITRIFWNLRGLDNQLRLKLAVPLAVAGPARITVYTNGTGVTTYVNAGFEWIEK